MLKSRTLVPPIYPWTRRSSIEVVAMVTTTLAAIVMAFVASNPVKHCAEGAITVILLITWLVWVIGDTRKLFSTVSNLPSYEPQCRPRLRLPFRHVGLPIWLAAVVGVATFGVNSLTSTVIPLIVITALLHVLHYVVQYMLLAEDSVEATLQRNAATISFLVIIGVSTGMMFGAALLGQFVASLVDLPSDTLVAELSSRHYYVSNVITVVALVPGVFVWCTYGTTYFFLKRRLQ